mmetsp:Transcript_32314/g.47413  ORF Transcript_32314/g.47413 Transcript_32314/m.47413 type:complete len:711 (+) Transcript_32314:111-2243(+)
MRDSEETPLRASRRIAGLDPTISHLPIEIQPNSTNAVSSPYVGIPIPDNAEEQHKTSNTQEHENAETTHEAPSITSSSPSAENQQFAHIQMLQTQVDTLTNEVVSLRKTVTSILPTIREIAPGVEETNCITDEILNEISTLRTDMIHRSELEDITDKLDSVKATASANQAALVSRIREESASANEQTTTMSTNISSKIDDLGDDVFAKIATADTNAKGIHDSIAAHIRRAKDEIVAVATSNFGPIQSDLSFIRSFISSLPPTFGTSGVGRNTTNQSTGIGGTTNSGGSAGGSGSAPTHVPSSGTTPATHTFPPTPPAVGTPTTTPTVIVIDDVKPLRFPNFNGKKTSFTTWWSDIQRILSNTKWRDLYDRTQHSVILLPVDPAYADTNSKLYLEVMAAMNDQTRSILNQRTDLLDDGVAILWSLYNKYTPTYDALTLQQAVNDFQSMKCTNNSFDTFATKIGTTRAILQRNGKTFTPAEIKNIFILGLGQVFEPIIDKHLENTLPADWQTMDINRLAEVATKYKKLQESKKQLFHSGNTPRNTEETQQATNALRSWQSTIKQLIMAGQLTIAQENVFQAQQPDGCYYHKNDGHPSCDCHSLNSFKERRRQAESRHRSGGRGRGEAARGDPGNRNAGGRGGRGGRGPALRPPPHNNQDQPQQHQEDQARPDEHPARRMILDDLVEEVDDVEFEHEEGGQVDPNNNNYAVMV